MPQHKQQNDWRVAPYSPENVHRLARLHVLALYAETGYTLRFSESANEWDVHFENMPEERSLTRDSTLLEHPLGDAIKMLEEYMNDHYINYPLPGKVDILKEGFWDDRNSDGNVIEVPDFDAKPWLGQEAFLNALMKVESILIAENVIQDHSFPPVEEYRGTQVCRICGDSSMHDFVFAFKGWRWRYDLKHYIEAHNHKPTDAFIHFIRKLDGKQLIKTDLAVIHKRGAR